MGISVKVYNRTGETIDHALKRMRTRMQKEQVLQELFERRYYKSESQKAREKKLKAIYLNKFKNN